MKSNRTIPSDKGRLPQRVLESPVFCRMMVVAAVLVVYGQCLAFGLVHFDDYGFVQWGIPLLKLTNIPAFFSHTVFWVLGSRFTYSDVYYRPLQNVVYALCNIVAAGSPGVYHLTGLLLHLGVSLALFSLLRALKYNVTVSFLFTLLYCIHPLLTEGVVWIGGIGDQLAALFSIISVTFFIKIIADRTITRRKFILIHLFTLAGALFSKEITVGIIPVCLLYFYLVRKRERKALPKAGDRVGLALPLFAGWAGVCILWFAAYRHAAGHDEHGLTGAVLKSIVANGLLIFEYIEKIFIPYRLSPVPARSDAHFILGAIIALLLFMVAVVKKRYSTIALFGLFWFFIFLLPALIQLNPAEPFYAFEHRLYLPLPGMLIFLAELAGGNRINIRKPVIKYCFAFVALMLMATTLIYERSYAGAVPFFSRAIAYSPQSSLAYKNYAEVMTDEKKYAEAVEAYKMSFRYEADAQTSGKIADIYMKDMNDAPDAVIWFDKTLGIDSSLVPAAVGIADAYLNGVHDTAKASFWYEKTLALDSANTFALTALGVISLKSGDTAAGRTRLIKLLRTDVRNLAAMKWLAISFFNKGKIVAAIGYLNRAFSISPGDVEIQRNLMICYYKTGDVANTRKFAELYSKGGNFVPDEIILYLKRSEGVQNANR
ncbi:MAG: hypothetical protein HKL88_01960 [Bacteroidia bacterium]|jgi:tetratricopeptide (TPR) repeat protein|nr:hypothetical protein [Bacteroidia bacterium]